MLLRTVGVDGLRRLGAANADVAPTGIILGAAVELACTVAAQQIAGNDALRHATDRWFRDLPLWSQAITWLADGRRPPIADDWSAPTTDVWAIEGEDDITGVNWTLFQDRFRRSAVQHGFSSELAAALSMAIAEMADNVFQHSGGARGVVAFHVVDRCVHWCVADLGRGVLASLRTNSRWTTLANAEDALTAVWRDHATSRPDATMGNGFRQVERSLASLYGQLRFRSDDAVLELSGATGTLKSTLRSNPPMVGLQIAASCALGNAPICPPLSH